MTHTSPESWALWRESTRFLAQGSSTSSKMPAAEPVEPAQIVRGKGCRVWDADGNEYIDYRNALGPVTLGYAVPEINEAITKQLELGIIFGHPHPREGEVARLLTEVIPCAERARFFKTGGEAIAACIKIARHATQRNKILQCGYNGWVNNLSTGGFRPAGIAAGTPEKGVPPGIAAYHQSMPWNDIGAWRAAFETDGEDIAAAIVACHYAEMAHGATFLPALRSLTKEYGALLIMDEIVTGFRLALGGAQEYFDFRPEMAVFGKGVANGMPLSAYVGRGDLIDSARGLAISTTFGGECLSLAAAKAAIELYRREKVIDHLWAMGRRLWDGVNSLLGKEGLAMRVEGLPVCPQFTGDAALIQHFMQAAYGRGVSLYHVSYVNFAHKQSDIDETLARLEAAISDTKHATSPA